MPSPPESDNCPTQNLSFPPAQRRGSRGTFESEAQARSPARLPQGRRFVPFGRWRARFSSAAGRALTISRSFWVAAAHDGGESLNPETD
jgi:hypothetical protein